MTGVSKAVVRTILSGGGGGADKNTCSSVL